MAGPFRILHLADLHAPGRELDYWPQHELVAAAKQRISEIAGSHGFDLLVCTGDLADACGLARVAKEQGVSSEIVLHQRLTHGFDLLKEFRECAGGRAANNVPVVLTPGNHDVLRPPDLIGVAGWQEEDRYKVFSSLCDSIDECVRPLLTEDERKEEHCDTIIRDMRLGLKHVRLPFYISSETSPQPVSVVPLATTDRAGTFARERGLEVRKNVLELQETLGNIPGTSRKLDEVLDKLFQATLMDPAFAHRDQVTALRRCLDRVRNEQLLGLGKRYSSSLRILATHHPLLPVHGLQAYGPFDTVANSLDVVRDLVLAEHEYFHLILFGHKHRMGCSIFHGTWRRHWESDNPVRDIPETACVAGGYLLKEQAGCSHGFQVIEIWPGHENLSAGFEVRVTPHLLDSDEPLREQRLITVDGAGRGRWIRPAKNPSEARLFRGRSVLDGFVRLVQVEEEKCAGERELAIQASVIDRADAHISELLRVWTSFCKQGERGVDVKFVEKSLKAARTASAMYFVDYEGFGTWYHPALLELLTGLFRALVARNRLSLNPKQRWTRGKWRHRAFIQAARTQKYFAGRTSQPDFSAAELVPFDMARILLWEWDQLCSDPGIALARLHQRFDVPLFWCDLKTLPRDLRIEVPHDYVLEFFDVGNRVDKVGDEGGLPAQIVYDPTSGELEGQHRIRGSRRISLEKGVRHRHWDRFNHLLNISKLVVWRKGCVHLLPAPQPVSNRTHGN